MSMERSTWAALGNNPLSGIFTFTSKQAHDGCNFKPDVRTQKKWPADVNRGGWAGQVKRRPARPSLNVSDCLEMHCGESNAHKKYEEGMWVEGGFAPCYEDVDTRVRPFVSIDGDGDTNSDASEEDWALTEYADESDLKR